jgi:hypothetical protein
LVQMGTIHQVSREVSSFVTLPKMILVWWLSRCFCLFLLSCCGCFRQTFVANTRIDLHIYQQLPHIHYHPRNKNPLSPVVNTTAQENPPGLTLPATNTTNTHLSLPERESVSSASDPASRLLQPGCNTEPDNGSTPFIRRTATSSKRNATLSMILGNRKADSTRQPRPRLQLL